MVEEKRAGAGARLRSREPQLRRKGGDDGGGRMREAPEGAFEKLPLPPLSVPVCRKPSV